MTAFWLIAALAAFVIEVLTPFFGFSLVGVAAVIGGIVSVFGGHVGWQCAAFGASSLVLLGSLRSRIAQKLAESAPGVPTRAEGLVGKRGRVVEAVDADNGHGRVLVDGMDWLAVSSVALPEGSEVVIQGHRGIKLIVAPAKTQG